MHNLAPDLWSMYGLPWDRLDPVWWDDFVVMMYRIDGERRARRERS